MKRYSQHLTHPTIAVIGGRCGILGTLCPASRSPSVLLDVTVQVPRMASAFHAAQVQTKGASSEWRGWK